MLGIRNFSDAWKRACLSDLIDMHLQEMWSLEYEWPALPAFFLDMDINCFQREYFKTTTKNKKHLPETSVIFRTVCVVNSQFHCHILIVIDHFILN